MTLKEAKKIRACNGRGYSTIEFVMALQMTELNLVQPKKKKQMLPDKIYTDGRNISQMPVFDEKECVEYIRKEVVEHIIRSALGPQDALNKLRSL